jgi:hypothetical protein
VLKPQTRLPDHPVLNLAGIIETGGATAYPINVEYTFYNPDGTRFGTGYTNAPLNRIRFWSLTDHMRVKLKVWAPGFAAESLYAVVPDTMLRIVIKPNAPKPVASSASTAAAAGER